MKLKSPLLILGAAFCLALGSCGGSDGDPSGPADSTPPTITQVSVPEGSTDIGLIQKIDVTFSEPMDPSTIDGTTIFVVGRREPGHVEYDGATRTASVIPETLYAAETPYALVVSDAVTDDSGNGLADPDTTSFETGPFGCDYLMDYLEPNDEVGEGTPIELDRLYRTLSVCGENGDYYRFTVEEPATVTATTTLKHCAVGESWGVNFLRTTGDYYATLGTTAYPGDTKSFRFSFFPGTYALRVFGYEDPIYVLYDLELVTSEPCPDDEYEDNDFRDEAKPIATGVTTDLGGCYLDADYYTFDVEAGQVVTVTATQHPHTGSIHSRMRIYDPSGASNGNDADVMVSSIERTMEQAGTCTIMVQFWINLVYDLDVAIDG